MYSVECNAAGSGFTLLPAASKKLLETVKNEPNNQSYDIWRTRQQTLDWL